MSVKASDFDPLATHRLSRFAFMRIEKGRFILQSPFNSFMLPLGNNKLFDIISLFSDGAVPQELLNSIDGDAKLLVEKVLLKLFEYQLLVLDEASASGEGADLDYWEFHDLLFHSRSRIGRHHYPVGGTYHFKGKSPMPPALKDIPPGEVINLATPDLTTINKQDISLTEALENRKSLRNYGEKKLQLEQISELLYRTCRVKSVSEEPDGSETAWRVYPSGGATYPLEVYMLIRECDGLESAAYYYDARKHRLIRVNNLNEYALRMLGDARNAMGKREQDVPILFCMGARIGRMSWKYQSLAYVNIVKEAGALMQTLYLVATAMNLAPCALGAGNSDLFSAVFGNSYYAEAAVGEFAIGPPDSQLSPQ